MAFKPVSAQPVEDAPDPALPGETPAPAKTGGFKPAAAVPVDLTPDSLADDLDFEPLAAARERRRVLESDLSSTLQGVDDPAKLDEAYKGFDRQLGADPLYNLFNQAHKKRVEKLAAAADYKPADHYADAGVDFPARGATVDMGGRPVDATLLTAAQRDTAAEVYAYRARKFGNPHSHQAKTDWRRVRHGFKEQAKDAFGVAGAARGMGYIADDAAYMGRAALGGFTGDASEVAKGDLAAREVQSGVLGGAMNIINLGYGLRDWWQGDDVREMSDAALRERFEDEVKRKIEIPRQLTPENLEPIGGGLPYKAVLAEAGGAAEAPKADLDWLRFGKPEGIKFENAAAAKAAGYNPDAATKNEDGTLEFGKPGEATDAQKRAGDVATRLEFSAYGKLMGIPGYSHVAKALAGRGAQVAGKAAEKAGSAAGKLIDSRFGRGATWAGAGGAALAGNPAAAASTFIGARIARAAARATEAAGRGVQRLGAEIIAGKPLAGGTRLGQAATEGAKEALTGGVAATPFVLGAETPEDGISTALGLALQGAAGKFGREALRGEARNQGIGQELADAGAKLRAGTGFDEAHDAATAALKPNERDTVNAIRGLMSRFKDAQGKPLEMAAVDAQTFERVLRDAFPGASEAQITEAARARGFVNYGNQVFVNAGAGADAGQTAKHEGGHLANRALAALDAHTRESAKAAVSDALYDDAGQPLPEFMDFVAGYNKKAPAKGQIDMLKPEDWVRAEDEFIAEHFRNLTSRKPGLAGIGALAGGDSLVNRMAAKYDAWAKVNGIRPPDTLGEFNWTEVPKFTQRFDGVLREAFKGAHKRPAPEPSAAAAAERNAARMAEIDRMEPGELTKAVLDEYDNLRKENAEIGRKLAQVGQKPAQPGGAVSSSPAAQKPPTTPAAAPVAPADAAMRNDVVLALNKLGIKGKEAQDLAAQAEGATTDELFASALSRRTGKKPALAAVTAPSVSPVAKTPALAPKPAPAEAPQTAPAARVTPAAPEPGPGGRAILTGTIEPAPAVQLPPGRAALAQTPPPAAPPKPPKAPPGLGALRPEDASSYGTKTQAPTGKLERTADDAAAEALIKEAPDKTQAALDLVTQSAGGDVVLLQKRTDPLTGKTSYSGRLDFSKPEHRTLVRQLGLTEPDIAKLQAAQGAEGGVRYVDYWSASKEDAADITGKQRAKELAADKTKRSRELLQKNKAIIFTGVTVWPSGKAVQKGISVDKFLANAGKLLKAAKDSKIDVGYEGINDPAVIADLQGYIANHRANYKGDGSGPVKGKTPAEGYEPYQIPRNRFDLLNAAFHIETSTAKTRHEGNLAADESRRAAGEKVRKRPALRPETELKAGEAQRVAQENDWQVDDATGDTNPFRALLNREGKLSYTNAAGETRKGSSEVLEGVFESLSPDNIDAVRETPAGERSIVREVGFTGEPGAVLKSGLPDWGNVEAGFMPGEPDAKKVESWRRGLSEEWNKGIVGAFDKNGRGVNNLRETSGDFAPAVISKNAKLYTHESPIEYIEANHPDWMEKRDKDVYRLTGYHTIMRAMEAEGANVFRSENGDGWEFVHPKTGETRKLDSDPYEEAIEFVAEKLLKKEGYDGAIWTDANAEKDSLVYRVWNEAVLRRMPKSGEAKAAVDEAMDKFNQGALSKVDLAKIINENKAAFMPGDKEEAPKSFWLKSDGQFKGSGKIHDHDSIARENVEKASENADENYMAMEDQGYVRGVRFSDGTIEVETPDGKVTPAQRKRLKEWAEQHEADVFVEQRHTGRSQMLFSYKRPGGFMPGEPIKREELPKAAKAAGVDYDGATEFGDIAFHSFSDTTSKPGTRITFNIEGEVTPEKIAAGRARKLKEFGVEPKEGGAFMGGNDPKWKLPVNKEEFRKDVVSNAEGVDPFFKKARAWMTPDGKFINVDEHYEVLPSYGEDTFSDSEDMMRAGFARVMKDGDTITFEHLGLTPKQKKAAQDAGIERAAKVEFDDMRKFGFMPGATEEFYSPLERIAKAKIKGRATAEQIAATLRNNGVKQEELDWVLGDFLREKAGQKIDPKELSDVISANKIELQEKQRGGDDKAQLSQDDLYEFENAAEHLELDESAVEFLRAYESGNLTDARGIMYDIIRHAENEGHPSVDLDALDAIYEKLGDESVKQTTPAPKFAQYQLPGGRNYRELLFTLPSGKKPSEEEFQKWVAGRYGDISKYTPIQLEHIRGDFERSNPPDEAYKSSHFDEPNILFHIRANDRQTADGREIVFAEEIQSDWHQAGRKKGYNTDKINTEGWSAKQKPTPERPSWMATADSSKKYWDVTIEDGSIVGVTAESAQDAISKAAKERGHSGIPNAPFKGEGWKKLALKKLLAQAVKDGKDAIGWTTGEQQAERYDLSKQLEEIEIFKDSRDGLYTILGTPKGDIAAEQLASKVPIEKLEDYVGKDIASKIDPDLKHQAFSGENLKVGGEGMKGFYDRELVNIANDIGKKYGARAEKKDLNEESDELDEIKAKATGVMYPKKYDAWVLPITPQLKAAVEAGQALFMPGAATAPKPAPAAPQPSPGALSGFVATAADEKRRKAVFAE